MKRVAITIPTFLMPKGDPENPCPCQERPIETSFKNGLVFWLKQVGERVNKAEIVCEVEIDKKTAALAAPAAGILVEQCIAEEGAFDAASILGYIEEE